LKTPFAEQWAGVIDELYATTVIKVEGRADIRQIPPERLDEWWNRRMQVDAIIKAHYPNVTKANAEIEALLKPTKENKAKSLIGTIIGLHPAMLAYEAGKRLGPHPNIAAFMAGKHISKFLFEEKPKSVDSLEEAEKLSQGTKFEYKGKVYTRR
jgi:hypothetical protein